MKKASLIIGFIALLVFGYVGGAWYTGNIIEKNIDNGVSLLTEKINTNTGALNKINDKYTVGISYSNYQKGLFSTKLHLTVTLTPTANNKLYQSFKETSDPTANSFNVFDEDVIIHHGPFPIAALIKGTFAPQAAWLEYQVGEKTSPELWKLAGNQPLLTGSMGISYQNDFRIKVNSKGVTLDKTKLQELLKLYQNMYTTYFDPDFDHSDELDYVFDNVTGKITVSDSEMYFETDPDFSNLTIKNHLSNLSYQKDNDNYALLKELNIEAKYKDDKSDFDFKINLDNLVNTNVNTNVPSPYLIKLEIDNLYSQGSFNFDKSNMNLDFGFDKFELVPDPDKPNETKPAIKLNKLDWKQKNLLNSKGKNNGSLMAKVDLLTYGKQNLGFGVIDLAYENMPSEQITYDPVKFMQKLYDLDQDKPEHIIVTLNKLNWHNAQGDISINGLLDFIPVEKNSSMRDTIDNIYTLKIKVSAPFNVMAQTMAQTRSLQKLLDSDVDPQELRQMKKAIKSKAMMFFEGSPLINFSEGNVEGIFSEIDFSKDSDEVKVNGKSLKKEDLFGN